MSRHNQRNKSKWERERDSFAHRDRQRRVASASIIFSIRSRSCFGSQSPSFALSRLVNRISSEPMERTSRRRSHIFSQVQVRRVCPRTERCTAPRRTALIGAARSSARNYTDRSIFLSRDVINNTALLLVISIKSLLKKARRKYKEINTIFLITRSLPLIGIPS